MKKTKEEWKDLIQLHKDSGQTIIEFCKTQNFHPNTFYYQRKKHKNKTGGSQNLEMVELAVKPETPKIASPLIVRIGKIEIIPGSSPDQNIMTYLFISALEACNASL